MSSLPTHETYLQFMGRLNSSFPSRFSAARRRNASATLLSQSFQRLCCQAVMRNHESIHVTRSTRHGQACAVAAAAAAASFSCDLPRPKHRMLHPELHRTQTCTSTRALPDPARKSLALRQQLKCQKLFAATWERSSLAAQRLLHSDVTRQPT